MVSSNEPNPPYLVFNLENKRSEAYGKIENMNHIPLAALLHKSYIVTVAISSKTPGLEKEPPKYESDKMTIIKTMNRNLNLQAYHGA